MKRKMKVALLIGCLLILVNMGIASTSFASPVPKKEELSGYETPVYNTYHADAGAPYSGNSGEIINFDGSGTFVGTAYVEYEWDFDDPNDDTIGYGKYPIHIYSEPGVYYVTLTATNAYGEEFIDISPVYIDRIADHLHPYGGCYYYSHIDEEITFDASESTSDGAEIVEYFWDFGDGETAFGEEVSHSYDEERVYIVTLDIKDSNGMTRHDVLHADIEKLYKNYEDVFDLENPYLVEILDYLLNRLDFTTGIFCNLLNAKIYTNYNGLEKWTDLPLFNPLPKKIDVNNNGVNDINVDELKFFRPAWAPSMFDDHSRVWLQFETTLSKIEKISNDITIEDDFTICLELDFDIISQFLDLDDTITRIGYNSASGEEMPDSISLTHILRPYLLFRIFGFLNGPNQGVNTEVVYSPLAMQPLGSPIDDSDKRTTDRTNPVDIGDSEDLEGHSQPSNPAQPYGPFQNSDDYWPEYGLKISSSGDGSFSLISIFLNEPASSETELGISYGTGTSTMMYKRTKDGGILNHGFIFEIPGNYAELFATREKNNEITELSAEFSFTTELFRGIGWSDDGVYLGFIGKFDVSIQNLIVDSPNFNFNLGELTFTTDGDFNLNLNNDPNLKVTIDGNAGFILADLFFNKIGGNFQAEIVGTLDLAIDNSVLISLGQGLLEVGFNGDLSLSSNCEFIVNEESITVGGDFSIDSVGVIAFSWGGNRFDIDLEGGLGLEISNLHFVVGEIIANAGSIEIETSGSFNIEWDSANNLVTISGGPGVSLGLRDLDFSYGANLYVSIFGSLEIQAGGYVTFGPDTFTAGFEGSLNLGTAGAYCEFEINQENIKVGGIFSLTGGSGEISFSWDNQGVSLDIQGSPELEVSDLYFEIGVLNVDARTVEIGVGGVLNIDWDTAAEEVTVSGDIDSSIGLDDININYNDLVIVNIIGSLDIQADGYVTFGSGLFKAGFTGTLDLGASTEFVINGEGITVGGTFEVSGTNGEISLLWDDEEFTLDFSGNAELSVNNFLFDVDSLDLHISAGSFGIGANGEINIDWDTTEEEITISSGDAGISFELTDLFVSYADIIEVQIIGDLGLDGSGYLTIGPETFVASFTGTFDFGASTEFIVNSESITVGGEFSLSSGNGEIGFNWASNTLSLYVSGGPSLEVNDLFFETGDISASAENIEIGANGQIDFDWDTAAEEVTISSDGGVSLSLTNISFSYSTVIELSVTGDLDLEADGELTIAPGILDASFSGALDFGASCEFEINSDSLTVGGLFTLSGGSGGISFSWSDDQLTLYVTGGPSLAVSNFYFMAGDLEINGDNVEIGTNGEFDITVDTTNSEITVSGGAGVSLSVENIDILYGTVLDVSIIGSFDLEADGWLTFGQGVLEAGFDGTLDLGGSCEFEINSESIEVGGQFTLDGGDGEISFLWSEQEFSLEVSGGPELTVDNLFFEADLLNELLSISSYEIYIGAYGDMDLEWDTANSEITFDSDLGVNFAVENLDFSYGTLIDLAINGRLGVDAEGSISFEPGEIEASFSGELSLSPGFNFEINTEVVDIEGQFSVTDTNGEIIISWTEDEFYCDVISGVNLIVNNFLLELEQFKVSSARFDIGFNGDLFLEIDKPDKSFELEGDVYFSLNTFDAYTKVDNIWLHFLNIDSMLIGGGGFISIDSSSDIILDFSGQFNLINLDINPPAEWNADLSIGSITLSGNAQILLEKDDLTGNGKFSLSSGSVDITGSISNFDASILLGSTELEINFYDFDIDGGLIISLDDMEDDLALSVYGIIDLDNFDASYGNFEITSDFEFDGQGSISGSIDENSLFINADVDVIWAISLDSSIIGDWEAQGNMLGDLELDAQWTSNSGEIFVDVNSPGKFNLLEITHNDITLNLLDVAISPGTISFEWLRDTTTQEGYILIDSNLNPNLCTNNLATLSWGTKSVSIGWPEINTGDFKFSWDIPAKTMVLNNGISGLGPTFTYADTSQNLEVSAEGFDLVDNYNTDVTLKWQEDALGISGIEFDSENTEIAEWLEATFIKQNEGLKMKLFGLKCDDFYIERTNADPNNPNYEWGGEIQIANKFTFSILDGSQWDDFTVEWDFSNDEKMIKLTKDTDLSFTLDVIDVTLLGFEIDLDVNLLHLDLNYLELTWDIGTDGRVSIDSGNEWVTSVTLEIWHSASQTGIRFMQGGIKANAWWVEWDLWPIDELDLETGGSLQIAGLEIEVYYNGQWEHLWPW